MLAAITHLDACHCVGCTGLSAATSAPAPATDDAAGPTRARVPALLLLLLLLLGLLALLAEGHGEVEAVHD